jgi:hypothetical protein
MFGTDRLLSKVNDSDAITLYIGRYKGYQKNTNADSVSRIQPFVAVDKNGYYIFPL